jgi:hypothetical protein
MGDYDNADRPPRRGRWAAVAAVVVALAAGLVAGYLLGRHGGGAAEWSAAPPPLATSVPPPPPTALPETPSPCVEVARAGTEVITQLEAAVRAIAALDPGALRGILDEVEALHSQLQRDVEACRGVPDGDAAAPPR